MDKLLLPLLESWFRDYLWFNSTPLIHGYSTLGTNDLSVQSWSFLLTHLAWASGFMFLISWRGYWQELIDIILYIHFDLFYHNFGHKIVPEGLNDNFGQNPAAQNDLKMVQTGQNCSSHACAH